MRKVIIVAGFAAAVLGTASMIGPQKWKQYDRGVSTQAICIVRDKKQSKKQKNKFRPSKGSRLWRSTVLDKRNNPIQGRNY